MQAVQTSEIKWYKTRQSPRAEEFAADAGSMVRLTIDGKQHRFESANIDMTGQAQIDFKAVDLGTCQIDAASLNLDTVMAGLGYATTASCMP